MNQSTKSATPHKPGAVAVKVSVRSLPEVYSGEPTGQTVYHAEAIRSDDPMARATVSVLGRGYTASDAVADWTRRAKADGHDAFATV